ncbi:aldo/keto reductase [Nocardiopsis rhodophaea]|uniref:aldo/keto reductase n=1 Tax=Nocardiopsis rhodophaea TaxID=280238 RepID=UPI0031D4BCDF
MTSLDTAYNYQRYRSHQLLAPVADGMLDQFEITSKVGFFPGGHDLTPERLRTAVRRTAEDLGRIPDTVLLHNPECSVDDFEKACQALMVVRDEKLCQAWGISTWNPQNLAEHSWEVPRPDVVMVRAGLSVPTHVLDAAERFTVQMAVPRVWGMAPFGGNAKDTVWSKTDTSLFLAPGQRATRRQAAVATAFVIPKVERLAVGISSPAHLAEIVQAESLTTSTEVVDRYRALLRRRAYGRNTA